MDMIDILRRRRMCGEIPCDVCEGCVPESKVDEALDYAIEMLEPWEEVDGLAKKVRNLFTDEHQKIKLMEECGELITALGKDLNGEPGNVEEEMADVAFLILQLRPFDILQRMKEKGERTVKRYERNGRNCKTDTQA